MIAARPVPRGTGTCCDATVRLLRSATARARLCLRRGAQNGVAGVNVVRSGSELQRVLAAARDGGRRVAFVPTMGALHDGHLSLLRRARHVCDVVVVSIFVNPLQFAPGEDYASYPRDERRDIGLATAEGVSIAFIPSVEEMYPEGAETTVNVGRLGEIVEGAARPGHFSGVATIVAKLFNLVRPDIAVFGQKDAQQLAVIRKMNADLCFGIEILSGPTVREPDGLALSSRNRYLSPRDRARATALFRALKAGRECVLDRRGPAGAEREMWEVLSSEEGVVPDYARAVDPDTFDAPISGRPVLLAVAARVGAARLIDNVLIEP